MRFIWWVTRQNLRRNPRTYPFGRLQRLSFIDSSGLRFILESDARARRDARRVAIVPGPEQVHRIFLIALLDKRLEFIEPDQVESIS